MDQHIKRLELKRKNDQILQKELDKKPGSGKIWKNKLTKPTAPKLTHKNNRKLKYRKADYLANNTERKQIDLMEKSQSNDKTSNYSHTRDLSSTKSELTGAKTT